MSEVDKQLSDLKEFVVQQVSGLNERQLRQEEQVSFKDSESSNHRKEMLNEAWLESVVAKYCKKNSLKYDVQCGTFVNRKGEKTMEGGRCDVAIRLSSGRLVLLELKLVSKNNVFSDQKEAEKQLRGHGHINSLGSSDDEIVLTRLHQHGVTEMGCVGALRDEAQDQAMTYAASVARRGFLEGGPRGFNHKKDSVHAATIVVASTSVYASHVDEFPPRGYASDSSGGSSTDCRTYDLNYESSSDDDSSNSEAESDEDIRVSDIGDSSSDIEDSSSRDSSDQRHRHRPTRPLAAGRPVKRPRYEESSSDSDSESCYGGGYQNYRSLDYNRDKRPRYGFESRYNDYDDDSDDYY